MKKSKFLARLCSLLLLIPTVCHAETAPQRTFSLGYAARAIAVDPDRIGDYYVAGYRNDWHATGILDDQQVKAVVIDDGDGPVVLVSIDCVAISSADVARIRASLDDFAKETGCRAIHITATHDHAGADTLGLWGPIGQDGKDPEFMRLLRERTAECVREAYASMTEGDIYFGQRDTAAAGIQEDTRAPYVFDTNIYSFRFVPRDPTKQTLRMINYATHAESLDGANSMISADLPAYVAEYLFENEGSAMIWFPGAIGGLMRTRFIRSDRVANCHATAEAIGREILAIDNEIILEPEMRVCSEKFSVPCENPQFIFMRFLGVLEHNSHSKGEKVWLDTEMTWLSMGEKQILMVPGEIFPELVYGNTTDFKGNFPEKEMPTLCSVFGDDLLIFGMADDEIGYIVAPSDFMVSEERPYVEKTVDKFGENHYEETNSAGPETAGCIYDAALRLKTKVDAQKR